MNSAIVRRMIQGRFFDAGVFCRHQQLAVRSQGSPQTTRICLTRNKTDSSQLDPFSGLPTEMTAFRPLRGNLYNIQIRSLRLVLILSLIFNKVLINAHWKTDCCPKFSRIFSFRPTHPTSIFYQLWNSILLVIGKYSFSYCSEVGDFYMKSGTSENLFTRETLM